METKKLDFMATLRDTVAYGLKNVGSMLLMAALYIITVWIPYLNVGTTIGLYRGIIEIGEGKVINPMILFDKRNFEKISDFFILIGIMTAGLIPAFLFMIAPGIVLSIAWGFALFFMIDKGLSPIECLRTSYKATYGEKWTIFFLYLALYVVTMALFVIFKKIPVINWLLIIALMICLVAFDIALMAVLYKHFKSKAFPEYEEPESVEVEEE